MKMQKEVAIPAGKAILNGTLTIPQNAEALIIFSHGSGSSRLSPRNTKVARHLHERKFGTLLFDLLTPAEDRHYENRFDIDLLTKRLINATEWLCEIDEARNLPVGYFGASTGAASALKAAAHLKYIDAVVSRGGRPDLVKEILAGVEAPTLLIVGSLDFDVLELNRKALNTMTCTKKLEIVKGATHLFEEPGAMDVVTELTTRWFQKYLQKEKIIHSV